METVVKNDFIERVALELQCDSGKARAIFEALLKEIKEGLARDRELMISGFGKFQVNSKAARMGRNPHTGERIELEPREKLVFYCSRLLKARLS